MALKYIEGDLFKSNPKVILHGCNMKGGFGSGFAGVLKNLYPEAANAYYSAFKNNNLYLGTVLWVEARGVLIGNCLTQPTFGRDGKQHISYEAFESCMRHVNQAAEDGIPGTSFEEGFSEVSMPMIGADLGGGDWNKLGQIIAEQLTVVHPTVFVLPGRKYDISRLPTFG
ncbi:macro domain-containing protein [Mesorhizobium sp. SP-1A]|uniref:macro domain-containing protein n=1 Tax=Mesorhizobium sp. SP-1A TaxID=3077840 RepID=UPI0028F74E0B|nr:macro domain-containing protein [Mesorhizobium sp. SP-1A]